MAGVGRLSWQCSEAPPLGPKLQRHLRLPHADAAEVDLQLGGPGDQDSGYSVDVDVIISG